MGPGKEPAPPDVTPAAARAALRARADPARAAQVARYFQTAPGVHGEGDEFLGIAMPEIRKLASEFRALAPEAAAKLLGSPKHEERMLALLILVERAKRATPAERDRIARLYLANLDRVDQWDLVDTSAPPLLGPYFEARSRAPLRRLARSRSVWRRRVAVLTTIHFIRAGEYDETLALAEQLLDDEHDLVHKAVGWMLREIGERDAGTLEGFLDEHAARMPRTMLRYAVEKLPDASRRRHMGARAREAPAGSGSARACARR